MEKRGVSNQELLKELRSDYAQLRAKEASALKKQASVSLTDRREMQAVKDRINEIEADEDPPNNAA